MNGYANRRYAESLSEFGTPLELPGCGGFLLERPIDGTPHADASWCYPLFACRTWSSLGADIAALGERLVSVAIVADPFGDHDPGLLASVFPDVAFAFKDHYVTDLSLDAESFIAPHHLRNSRRALQTLEVEVVASAPSAADEWVALYDRLVQRHQITGIAAFSHRSLRAQLDVPGATLMRATRAGVTVGMVVWYEANEVAYYHLAAYSEEGYDSKASFAIFRTAIAHFAPRARWLALGGGAGVGGGGDDGLTRFKRGWATGTRPAWFCGRILDRPRYAAIASARGLTGAGFFPLYRKAEGP